LELLLFRSAWELFISGAFSNSIADLFSGLDGKQVTLPAQIILACFALAVIIAGRIQDKVGPRPVAIAGGLMLAAGLILASLTSHFPPDKALSWLIVTYSVIGGLGIGAAYVCPIATCVKWFPDKRGLITGLAVAGFGAGAFFFAPLAKRIDRRRLLSAFSGKPLSFACGWTLQYFPDFWHHFSNHRRWRRFFIKKS